MVTKKKATPRQVTPDIQDSEIIERLDEIEARLDRLERGQLPAPEPAEEVKE